jgi:glycine/sarcosine N-methyltransferase
MQRDSNNWIHRSINTSVKGSRPMARAIESTTGPAGRVAEFYDTLAPDYDAMTGFEGRFAREEPFFRSLVEKFSVNTALDAGCGSGFHSLLLAQLGVKVTAVDVSAEMLHRLRKHALELDVQITTLQCRFQEIRESVPERQDAILCLGNSLAHILRTDGLGAAFRSFAGVLRPGGIVVLQLLNFERILARRDRIQSVKESGGKTYVRLYDYDKRGIVFNIVTLERSQGGTKQRVASVRIRPWLRSEILTALKGAGFAGWKSFGGISMERFASGISKDLVVTARRVK